MNTLQKITKAKIAVERAAGLQPFYKTISLYLIFNRKQYVFEGLLWKKDSFVSSSQFNDLWEAAGSVIEKEKLVAEVCE